MTSDKDSGHKGSGHKDPGGKDSGHKDSGHKDSGPKNSGNKNSGTRTNALYRFAPGLRTVTEYDRSWFRADLFAGMTLWAMLVPQALGFAALAQLPPVVGLYGTFGAMALYWLWGTSRFLNLGAEATVALLIGTSLSPLAEAGSDDYMSLAILLSLITGVVLIIGGVLRLGRIADFLSRPVLAGYVFGSGVLIVTSQLQGFFGTNVDSEPYLNDLFAVIDNLRLIKGTSVIFGLVTAATILLFRKFAPSVPGALLAMIGSIVFMYFFPVDVAVVGGFKAGIPTPSLPFDVLGQAQELILPALALALLIYPDSVLTARSLTEGTSDTIDANREFFGLGAASIGAGLMTGMPVNASQSRSFVLADAGAKSQVGNLVAAFFLLLTMLFLAPIFDYLPLATLAAVVIIAGFGLFDIEELRELWTFHRIEFAFAALTVAAVLVLGMLEGIIVAVILSLFAVAIQASAPHAVELGRVPGTDTFRDVDNYDDAETYPGIYVCRFGSDLFFANVASFSELVMRGANKPDIKAVVVDMEAVSSIDSTAAQTMERLFEDLERADAVMVVARARQALVEQFDVADLTHRLAYERSYFEVDDAVEDLQRRFQTAELDPQK